MQHPHDRGIFVIFPLLFFVGLVGGEGGEGAKDVQERNKQIEWVDFGSCFDVKAENQQGEEGCHQVLLT